MGKVDALRRSNSSNRILKAKETNPEWLDMWGVAGLLCQSFNIVAKWNKEGILPTPSFILKKGRGRTLAWRKADILEWDAIGRPSAEEYRDRKEMAQKKAIAFFDPLPFKPVDKMVDKYR